jgi:hypothetical protein
LTQILGQPCAFQVTADKRRSNRYATMKSGQRHNEERSIQHTNREDNQQRQHRLGSRDSREREIERHTAETRCRRGGAWGGRTSAARLGASTRGPAREVKLAPRAPPSASARAAAPSRCFCDCRSPSAVSMRSPAAPAAPASPEPSTSTKCPMTDRFISMSPAIINLPPAHSQYHNTGTTHESPVHRVSHAGHTACAGPPPPQP